MQQQAKASPGPERAAFYERIGGSNLAPLWEVLHGLVTREPVTPVLPAHWSYEAIRPYVMEAGGLITAKEAERRVLILENPGLRGRASITHISRPGAGRKYKRTRTTTPIRTRAFC